jgi:2,4-dienoyl-CoA reductase-like NADH-dependent reductase (Old Yellow Enzyme family)
MTFRRLAQLRTRRQFEAYLKEVGAEIPVDSKLLPGAESPLGQPCWLGDRMIGNRFCIQPMEGWDGTLDGRPTDLVFRRWRRFGRSGAKLIWGGEAVAVRHDGRANPNQLLLNAETAPELAGLRRALVAAHAELDRETGDLLVGLQLTHSGRFARPDPGEGLKPRILFHNPFLARKFGLQPGYPVLTDDEIREIIASFVESAVLAHQAGFDFVDIKHCHGYLGHEFLAAYERPGDYGGNLENRTRFLREVVSGIRERTPGLMIGVRLSAFDSVPFRPGADGVGEPAVRGPYRFAFGADETGRDIDLAEPIQFLSLLEALDIKLVNVTAGSPYTVPHIQRPALFPPSDGYGPPEDPLVGVARLVNVTAELKRRFPELVLVGTGYTYLQEWLPCVAQATVGRGMVDFVGVGRMALAYPELPADVLAGRPLDRKRICRTLSDCTTAPRKGLVSGCYPLDPFYKERPEALALKAAKEAP